MHSVICSHNYFIFEAAWSFLIHDREEQDVQRRTRRPNHILAPRLEAGIIYVDEESIVNYIDFLSECDRLVRSSGLPRRASGFQIWSSAPERHWESVYRHPYSVFWPPLFVFWPLNWPIGQYVSIKSWLALRYRMFFDLNKGHSPSIVIATSSPPSPWENRRCSEKIARFCR